MSLNRKLLMEDWDYWRKIIANGDPGSYPRDWFESVLDSYDEEIIELTRKLKKLEEVKNLTSDNKLKAEIAKIIKRLEDGYNNRDPETFGYAIIDLQKL